jgi:hypothetical protein
MKLYTQKAEIRNELETTTAAGQQKQAIPVNHNRSWDGGQHIPKDSMCVLSLTKDKNKVGIKYLPVLVTQVIYYKQSDQMRYKLC